jgi:regulator of protease activity HflC (stomatin/prohibitin superfamily)
MVGVGEHRGARGRVTFFSLQPRFQLFSQTTQMRVLLLLALSASCLLTSCGMNRVEPNNEGVLMENYGRGGRADFKPVTGAQGILGPGSELYQVPMWEQKADPEAVYITAKDGGNFTVDPTYSYQPIRGKGADIVFNYRHVGLGDSIMQALEGQILNPLVLDTYREQARSYTTDYLIRNMGVFEKQVEAALKTKMEAKFFTLTNLTSGLNPPESMVKAIERTNNAVQQAEQVKNELAVAEMLQKKASIDAETNRIKSAGLTKEVLMQQWIEALRTTQNKVIITDGRTPVILGQ